jgi:enoyl-CoA hydratase/carnithine racemase
MREGSDAVKRAMTTGPVTIERRETIAIVRFDRGGRANALDFAAMDALADAAVELGGERHLAAVVLTGPATGFSSGMDLRDPAFQRLDEMDLAELRHLAAKGPAMCRAWGGIEVPTVAAIEGPCLGGGLALASMCDFRVAGAGARFGAPEVSVGVNMGWHAVPRLLGLVGAQATRRLLLAGEDWGAAEALSAGFIDRVVAEGGALDGALGLAAALARQPAEALRMTKRQIEAAAHGLDWLASALDSDQHALAWLGADFRRTLAAFANPKGGRRE